MKTTPRTVAAAFNEFDAALNLDPSERRKAQQRHQEITEVLVSVGIAVMTFLQGSFARKTMLKPLKDVDMVVSLAEVYRPLWFGPGRGGPAKAMAKIAEAILSRWPDARFDVNDAPAHALKVTFADCSFTFDLVPAFDDPDGGETVHIADREKDTWEPSNARTLNRVVQVRNVATGGQFVHQARMGKQFRTNNPQLHELDGIVIESLWYWAINTKLPHALAMVTAFEHAATAVLGAVPDPTGVEDLAKDWSDVQRSTYGQAFAIAAKRGREALDLGRDREEQAAIEIWHDVLGEPFSEAHPQAAKEALTALVGGSITSRGRAITSKRGVEPNRPARSWRSR